MSRDIIPNKQSEYAKLSTLLTKGRMAGVVDWDAIEDRLRVPEKPGEWDSPKELIETYAQYFRRERMEGQEVYIEVWVEKDALSGVLKRVTEKYGINLMVNRGYSSTSAMHDAYQRVEEAMEEEKKVVILYLGDHDPSGIDMIRDIKDRMDTFSETELHTDWFKVKRIALTPEQIEEYNPPPNPTKLTDPRADWYIKEHGHTCWEVDALTPQVLHSLLEDNILELIDYDLYEQVLEKEREERDELLKVAKDNWPDGDDDDAED